MDEVLDDAAQERLEDAIDDARHEKRLELLACRQRVEALEKTLRDILDCIMPYGEHLVIRCGDYEVPIGSAPLVAAICAAYAALGELVPGEKGER